jgi:hypothetical protein
MTRIFVCALVLLATPLIAAQQPPQNPPYTTPPTLPDNRPDSRQPPELPDQHSQQAMTSSDIEQQLEQSISEDATLKDADIRTKVDDESITLTGTVQSESEHSKVLATVQPYAGRRKVVDKLVVKKTT